jgi:hypothetical protein
VLLCRSLYRQPGALASLAAYSYADRFPHSDPYAYRDRHTFRDSFLDTHPNTADAHPDRHPYAYSDPYHNGHNHPNCQRNANALAQRDEHAASHRDAHAGDTEPHARDSYQHTDANPYPAADRHLGSCQRDADANANRPPRSERYGRNARARIALTGRKMQAVPS